MYKELLELRREVKRLRKVEEEYRVHGKVISSVNRNLQCNNETCGMILIGEDEGE